jgi:hypothetical protein
MGFVVTRPVGAKDGEFEAYVRLLRQRGIDLGNSDRVPDPGTHRRWLYVWPSREAAEEFARALRDQTGDHDWAAQAVNAPPSKGPLGPVLIQLSRRGNGLLFALHPLSRAMIRSAFPDAAPSGSNISIDAQTYADYVNAHRSLQDLVQGIAPVLTGLSADDLEQVGYAVIDDSNGETHVFVPPADAAQLAHP